MIGIGATALSVRDALLGVEPGRAARRLALATLTASIGWSAPKG